ncbi:unnamed protein product, partial [Notodromas monacha]
MLTVTWSSFPPGEFPYQVALKINNGPRQHLFCGGTLISRTWVITAAHCLEWMDGKYENVRVILGEHDLMNEKELTEQDFGIKAVVLHEEYDKWKLWYDIALILLDGVAEFSENVRPINLPKRLETESIGNATISGWGATREGGAASEVLMKAYVPIVPDDRCRSDYEDVEGAEIIASHICAGHERGGIDSCQGDSGGPMVCTERVLQSGRRFFRVLTNGDETEENDRPNQLSKNRWNLTFGSKEVPVVGKKEEGEVEPVETGPYLCGVVSFGAGCGRPGHPGVYTQVSYFLPWLKKSIASFTDHQDGHEESNMATLPTKDFYPFMGMVSYIPIDLLSRKDPVSCVGTLLAENLVLTSADCITPFIEDNEGNSFWVGFGKHVVPGSKHFQRIPVSDWFGFRPDRFLRDIADGGSGDDSSSSKASQSNSANKALVLELAWGLVYDNDAYPVNLPMMNNFTGMRAQLVSLTHKKDKYFFRLKMKPRVGEFELTDLSACGEDSLRVYNLDPQDALCGRMISGTRKCLDFAAGSALICHTNIDRENGTSDSFICGMLARPID